MAILGWIGFGVLSWLLLGLMAVRVASRLGHIWGFHFRHQISGRAAIILQAPALILECAVMDACHPNAERLSVAAARLMWAKFKDPRADVDALAQRMGERRAG